MHPEPKEFAENIAKELKEIQARLLQAFKTSDYHSDYLKPLRSAGRELANIIIDLELFDD